jgi:hypothetical protein
MRYTVHAHEVYVCEVHAHGIHACEIYAREVHVHEIHANEVYAYEVHGPCYLLCTIGIHAEILERCTYIYHMLTSSITFAKLYAQFVSVVKLPVFANSSLCYLLIWLLPMWRLPA